MKRSDWFVLRIVLGGVAIATAALVISESQTLSKMAMGAFGQSRPDGPVVQIIERPVEALAKDPPIEKTEAPSPAADVPADPNPDPMTPVSESLEAPSPSPEALENSAGPIQHKLPAAPAAIDKNRVAFVVGNNDYQSVPRLRNAVTDATAIATTLRNLGFTVTLITNASERQFAKSFDAWLSTIGRKSESVFFFAGHGVQVDGKNYLLSTDAVYGEDQGLPESTPSLQALMERWARRGPRFSIAIVDACRDNPFPARTRSLTGAMTRSLEPTSAGSGQVILYSAGSGQTALDNLGPGDTVVNSVFTRALLKHMPNPSYSVDQVLRQTRMEVIDMARRAGYEQTPALYDESTGEFFFNPKRTGS